jgi:uncharacterized membrane protein YjjB (DUF3815 family)
MGFAILFNIPKDTIIKSGIVGALGWFINLNISNIFDSAIAGTFSAALAVGIMGEILSRNFRKPATIYIIPGIIPLVPGAGMYYTMFALIGKNFSDAANLGTETLFIAVAIASGIIISSTLSYSIKRVRNKS